MATKPQLWVISGPTAVGKTALTIRLAHRFQTEILSFDSRQFYRELSIGTAKPTQQEMEGIPHHFIDCCSVHDPLSAGEFERLALVRLNELFTRHKVVIATGGSGLYLSALLYGIESMPEIPDSIREEVKRAFSERGLPYLQEQVRTIDPTFYAEADVQNPFRLMRAWEVFLASGKPYSTFRKGTVQQRPWQQRVWVLEREREELYRRIDQRVHAMLEAGLLEEVKQLTPSKNLQALQTVGYSELFDHLEGKTSFDEAVSLIQRNSRRYAKRQLTWFRRYPEFEWVHPNELEAHLPESL